MIVALLVRVYKRKQDIKQNAGLLSPNFPVHGLGTVLLYLSFHLNQSRKCKVNKSQASPFFFFFSDGLVLLGWRTYTVRRQSRRNWRFFCVHSSFCHCPIALTTVLDSSFIAPVFWRRYCIVLSIQHVPSSSVYLFGK